MIKYISGNILESEAYCLVNTVNCEGYMGKGIAYQFKLKFPDNNRDYVRACKNGELRIGTIHYYHEDNRLIINLPTKDKWREKSKIEYIHKGLEQLSLLLNNLPIHSIAIPPLGCGNGGLNWSEVKPLIINYLAPFSNKIDIFIYEPSQYFQVKTKEAPQINASHLILMAFKPNLKRFSKFRLQKSAYFMNIFSKEEYFKFDGYKYGPYAHSIDILIKDINEFQGYYNASTEEAFSIAKNILTSQSVEKKLDKFIPFIDITLSFINSIRSDLELELLSSICYLIESKGCITANEVISGLKNWSEEKAEKFSDTHIKLGIEKLLSYKIIDLDMTNSLHITSENFVMCEQKKKAL